MIMPHKQICDECGKEYWQGCLRISFKLLCDECVKKELDKVRGKPEYVAYFDDAQDFKKRDSSSG